MKHTLICGVTESGKTTLAREIARRMGVREHNMIVFDPVGTATAGGDWPKSAIIFNDIDKFTDYVERDDVRHAHVFVDESADVFSHSQKDNHWMLRRGRHKGLQFFLIAQRPKMLPPNVRTQCSICYCFRLALDDLKEIAADFGHNVKDILEVNSDEEVKEEKVIKNLDSGDYLVLTSGSATFARGNIFNQLQKRK
jgi:hypothetical protein